MFARMLKNIPVQLWYLQNNASDRIKMRGNLYSVYRFVLLGPRQCRTYHAGTATGKIEMSLHEDDKTR